jgi:hypothetical protein
MRHLTHLLTVTALALSMAAPAVAQVAQEKVDLDVVRRIREEGLQRRADSGTAGRLTDVIGPGSRGRRP